MALLSPGAQQLQSRFNRIAVPAFDHSAVGRQTLFDAMIAEEAVVTIFKKPKGSRGGPSLK